MLNTISLMVSGGQETSLCGGKIYSACTSAGGTSGKIPCLCVFSEKTTNFRDKIKCVGRVRFSSWAEEYDFLSHSIVGQRSTERSKDL